MERSPAPDNGERRQVQQDYRQPQETGNSAPARAGRDKLAHQLIGAQRSLGINERGLGDHVVESRGYGTVEDSQRALASAQLLYGFHPRSFRQMFLRHLFGQTPQMLGEQSVA